MAEKQELNYKGRFYSPNEDEDTPATSLCIKLFREKYYYVPMCTFSN